MHGLADLYQYATDRFALIVPLRCEQARDALVLVPMFVGGAACF